MSRLNHELFDYAMVFRCVFVADSFILFFFHVLQGSNYSEHIVRIYRL